MIKSMTAYGRAECDLYTIEIVSINKRSLEMAFSIPAELLCVEVDFRRLLRERLARGMVTVRISKGDGLATAQDLKKVKEHWVAVAGELGVSKDLSLEFLLSHNERGVPGSDQKVLEKGFCEAIDRLNEMRLAEGCSLSADLKKRVAHLKTLLERVRMTIAGVLEEYRDRLLIRMQEVLEVERDDGRILKEAALYAEKCDTTEELVRLDSHCKQFLRGLEEVGPVGKRLDFLAQEMFREVQTLCAKSSRGETLEILIEMKGEIEKIREQVQNIE